MFNNIPNHWKIYKLKDLFNIQRGGSPRPIEKFITNDEQGINWIKIGDAEIGSKYIEKTKEKIIKEGITKSRIVEEGDFILSNSMSFGRPYIMKTRGCIHDGWLVLREKTAGITDKDYIYYILSSDAVYSQFKNAAAGGVVNNLNIQRVENVSIPVPPSIAEQKEIATILDAASGIVRLRQESIDHANKLIPATFQEMFGNPLNNEKNFPLYRLDNIATVVSGGTPSTKNPEYWDGNIPWLTPKDLSGYSAMRISRGERMITELGYKHSGATMMPTGSVLFTSRAPIGYVAIAQNDICTNQGFKSFIPGNKIKSEYLYQVLKMSKEYIENMASGSTFKEISGSRIKEIKIPVAPIELQEQFAEKAREIEEYKRQQYEELEKAKQMFNSLLHHSFTGELTRKAYGD